MLELTSLFFAAFFSATILPGISEAYMLTLYYAGGLKPHNLVIVATIGNVCGGVFNYLIGRYLLHFKDRKWFPANDEQLQKATNAYNKWGFWSLGLAWLPVIGDAFTIAAGIFKTNIFVFLLLVTVGKAGRYIFVMAVAMAIV
jgi:membrane protein YqaA with SNARE-associated domain